MKVGKAGGEKWKSLSKAVSSRYRLKLLMLIGMCMDNESYMSTTPPMVAFNL